MPWTADSVCSAAISIVTECKYCFDKDLLGVNDYRPSAGFISIIWFIDKIKTYKSIDLIGFDFFHKQTTIRPKAKRGKVGNCNPHSWHLPVYVLNRPAHDRDMEEHYMSSLKRRGIMGCISRASNLLTKHGVKLYLLSKFSIFRSDALE